MERLERSASTLDQLAEEVTPGVCLMSDAPQQSLRQVAGELRHLMDEVGVAADLAFRLKKGLTYTRALLTVVGSDLPQDPREYTAENVSEFQEVLADMREAAQFMWGAVEKLQVLLRGPPVAPRPGPVDLRQAIDSALQLVSPKFKGRIEIVRAEGELPAVWATPARLGQVLYNLLDTVACCLLEGHISERRITFSTEVTDERVKLLITDTGPGLSEDALSRLFEPFFKTLPHTEGTGLGLVFCRDVLRSMGGSISARSQLGKGTTMEVELWRADRPNPEGTQEAQ
jgi:signal transduction histidine kinase